MCATTCIGNSFECFFHKYRSEFLKVYVQYKNVYDGFEKDAINLFGTNKIISSKSRMQPRYWSEYLLLLWGLTLLSVLWQVWTLLNGQPYSALKIWGEIQFSH